MMGFFSSLRVLAILAAGSAAIAPVPAAADDATSPKGMLDSALEKLEIKSTPADPAPEFVTRTRPDVSGLDYMQRQVPHKVSPIPTKTPDEVQAMKNALDQARDRQLAPPPPAQIVAPKTARTNPARAKAVPAKPQS